MSCSDTDVSPDLTIERFCMTGGQSPIGYLKAYMTNLYLSKDSEKVQEAIEEGMRQTVAFKRNVQQGTVSIALYTMVPF